MESHETLLSFALSPSVPPEAQAECSSSCVAEAKAECSSSCVAEAKAVCSSSCAAEAKAECSSSCVAEAEAECSSSCVAAAPAKAPKRARPVEQSQGDRHRRKKKKDPALHRYTVGEKVYERQSTGCKHSRYETCVPCTQCRVKRKGDSCRFVRVRSFEVDRDGNFQKPIFRSSDEPDPPVEFERPLFRQPAPEHLSRIKTTVASALLPILERERQHALLPGVIRRPRELDTRIVCDFCLTGLFSASFLCPACGREYCLDCAKDLADAVGRDEELAKGSTLARLATCQRKSSHKPDEWLPVTRFQLDELQKHIVEMKALVGEDHRGDGEGKDAVNGFSSAQLPLHLATDYGQCAPSFGFESPLTPLPSPEPVHVPLESTVSGKAADEWIGSLKVTRQSIDELTHDKFAKLWASGEPLVVTGIIVGHPPAHGSRPPVNGDKAEAEPLVNGDKAEDEPPVNGDKAEDEPPVNGGEAEAEPSSTSPVSFSTRAASSPWTPERFIQDNGGDPCLVVECNSEEVRPAMVGDFFHTFGKVGDEKTSLGAGVWKLKDWPSTSEFNVAFPALFGDFHAALPAPDYTRLDGSLSISAYFPSNALKPDLGPKMYAAHAADEGPGGQGSTRLHMDMSDAVNIMVYASPSVSDGSKDTLTTAEEPGTAAWDIFPASASDEIRSFIRAHLASRGLRIPLDDPIHDQTVYLDSEMRCRLWAEKGVRSWRILQKPGEAVFIPAGCAHQVSNRSDCIKIAVDFVSPDNVGRCAQLTREFRGMTNGRAWKEDVLQLNSMLWWAWLACSIWQRNMDGAGKESDGLGERAEEGGGGADGTKVEEMAVLNEETVAAGQGANNKLDDCLGEDIVEGEGKGKTKQERVTRRGRGRPKRGRGRGRGGGRGGQNGRKPGDEDMRR